MFEIEWEFLGGGKRRFQQFGEQEKQELTKNLESINQCKVKVVTKEKQFKEQIYKDTIFNYRALALFNSQTKKKLLPPQSITVSILKENKVINFCSISEVNDCLMVEELWFATTVKHTRQSQRQLRRSLPTNNKSPNRNLRHSCPNPQLDQELPQNPCLKLV